MELGQALQRRPCLTRAHVRVIYGHRHSCGLDFSSGGLLLRLLTLGFFLGGDWSRPELLLRSACTFTPELKYLSSW